jgi:fumarylacetoacetase
VTPARGAALNRTHDPEAGSWVETANAPRADFPVQNLPLGAFTRAGAHDRGLGVAIGDQVLDLRAAIDAGLLGGLAGDDVAACRAPVLNPLMARGPAAWSALRARLHALLRAGDPDGEHARARTAACLVPVADVTLHVPADIGDYTDFYASIHHATNVGRMLRPDQPLFPNYRWMPVAYHGRASSIVVSGTPIRRPRGQARPDPDGPPEFGATRRLDYEVELAALVGTGNPLGTSVPVGTAGDHLFGVCLLNDWSARDIQGWEYQPLGPFLGKNFATTISPWVVTMEALRPYRVPRAARPDGDPPPLAHLENDEDRASGGLALTLEVWLSTATMRQQGLAPARLSVGDLRNMYWTLAQMVAHHTSGGCNLRSGDVIASGTVSGPDRSSRGCLLELTWRGSEPIELPGGELRRFLEDGDEVVLRGRAVAPGHRGLGLGECRGTIVGAPGSADQVL